MLEFDNRHLVMTDHTCLFDQFYVTGGSNPVPTVCGTNIGHHSKSETGGVKSDTILFTATHHKQTVSCLLIHKWYDLNI